MVIKQALLFVSQAPGKEEQTRITTQTTLAVLDSWIVLYIP
jgi:hypothetical protein